MLEILTQLGIILVVSFFLKEIADRVSSALPFIVLLIFAGTLFSTYGILDVKSLAPFPEMIRTIALILVVFSSAFYINVEKIKTHSKSILMLAVLGVILTWLIITTTTLYLLPIPLITAALLGALLSGTDPAAISTAIPKKGNEVADVLRAESLFNSPFTVILPLLILDFVATPEQALLNIPKLFLLIAVGAIIGAIGGALGRRIMQYTNIQHVETLGLAIAIATFVIAENFLGSGILAVAVCSVMLNTGHYPKKKFLGEFNSELAFISTLFVFMLLGAQFTVQDLYFERLEIFAILVALILARILTVFIVLFNSEFKIRDKIKIGLIAPKGVAPAALAPLALMPSLEIIGAESVVKITYLAIVISILLSVVVAKLTVKPTTPNEEIKEQLEEKKISREKNKSESFLQRK